MLKQKSKNLKCFPLFKSPENTCVIFKPKIATTIKNCMQKLQQFNEKEL